MRRPRRSLNPGGLRYLGRAAAIRAPRPRSVLRVLLLIGLGAALGSAVYGGTILAEWAVESDTFSVKTIRVSGIRDLSRLEVLEAAGVKRGVNIFKVSLDDIKRSVEALPSVKRCVVQRKLPHELIVRVAERRPYFLVNRGCVWRADRDGVVLGKADAGDLDRMFVAGWDRVGPGSLAGGLGPPIGPGVALEREKASRMVAAIAMIERVAPDLRGVVSEICVTDEGEVVLFTSDPSQRVRLGRGRPNTENLVALGAVIGDLKRRGLAGVEVDLRFDRQLVASPGDSCLAMSDSL